MKIPEEIDKMAVEWRYGEPGEAFLAGLRAGLDMAAEIADDEYFGDEAADAIRAKAEELK